MVVTVLTVRRSLPSVLKVKRYFFSVYSLTDQAS